MYENIADAGNIQMETGWGKSTVTAVGKTLVKRGLVTFCSTDEVGFEGQIWTMTEEGKRLVDSVKL